MTRAEQALARRWRSVLLACVLVALAGAVLIVWHRIDSEQSRADDLAREADLRAHPRRAGPGAGRSGAAGPYRGARACPRASGAPGTGGRPSVARPGPQWAAWARGLTGAGPGRVPGRPGSSWGGGNGAGRSSWSRWEGRPEREGRAGRHPGPATGRLDIHRPRRGVVHVQSRARVQPLVAPLHVLAGPHPVPVAIRKPDSAARAARPAQDLRRQTWHSPWARRRRC
jgi:hypothetical protein